MLKSSILSSLHLWDQVGFRHVLCLFWNCCAWCCRVEWGIVSPPFLTSFPLAPASSTPQNTSSLISRDSGTQKHTQNHFPKWRRCDALPEVFGVFLGVMGERWGILSLLEQSRARWGGGGRSVTPDDWKVGPPWAVRRTQSSTQDKCRAHDPAEMPSCHNLVSPALWIATSALFIPGCWSLLQTEGNEMLLNKSFLFLSSF